MAAPVVEREGGWPLFMWRDPYPETSWAPLEPAVAVIAGMRAVLYPDKHLAHRAYDTIWIKAETKMFPNEGGMFGPSRVDV